MAESQPNNLVKGIYSALDSGLAYFTNIVLGTFFGGTLGGLISWLPSPFDVLAALGHFGVNIQGLSLAQVGALLGFISGFFTRHQAMTLEATNTRMYESPPPPPAG